MGPLLLISILVQCSTIIYGYSVHPRSIDGIPRNATSSDVESSSFYVYSATSGVTCSGALISDRWIVTAAQCLRWKEPLDVYIGLTVKLPAIQRTTVAAANQHIYPGFGEYRRFHDIGLIDLPEPVSERRATPVSLPSDCSSLHAGLEEAVIVGTVIESHSVRQLQFTPIETMTSTECASYISSKAPQGSVICAQTADGETARSSGTGGPLLQRSDNALIGISSFVPFNQYSTKNIPVQTFTHVPFYIDWIAQKTGLDVPRCKGPQAAIL